MKNLGIYRDKDGRLYDLIYFPDLEFGQAVGPLPEGVGAGHIAAKVRAASDSEAKKLLIEKLAAIEIEEPTLITTTKTESGKMRTTSTTLPPELINADPESVGQNASGLIVQDNPDLKPLQELVAKHIAPLLSGNSQEEKLSSEAVRQVGKTEINIKYTQNLFISRDAYLGDHVGSMGPTNQNVTLVVDQIWQEAKNSYGQDIVVEQLRTLANKLDAVEDRIDNLEDPAIIETAVSEMNKGKGPKALRLLSRLSKQVLETSKTIGTNIATELIMKMMDLK